MRTLLIAIALTSGFGATAGTASARENARQAVENDNAELAAMFEADQRERQDLMAKWSTRTAEENNVAAQQMSANDEQRRADVAAMLTRGEVQTGKDFYHAAFIFQHGGSPESYLRAHTLSMTALAKGYSEASWLSAASLDRYLVNIGQRQIFGTQYVIANGVRTQKEMAKGAVSDAERVVLGVDTLEEQRQKMAVDKQ